MKEALKLALDLAIMHHSDDGYAELRSKVRQLAKEALAQPEQEPVGEFKQSPHVNYPTLVWNNGYVAKFGDKLYTTPPKRPWVGLTAQEAADCWTTSATKTWHNFEAALRSKNT